MLKVYEWLVYNFMRPHKKFQHLIKWFDICFIRTKTNINKKRKERLNRGKRKNLPGAQAEPAHPSPAGPQGQGGLLLPPAPPSCSVECHRASRGRHVDAAELPGRPVPLLAPGASLESSASIPPLQSFLLLLPCSISSPPESAAVRRRKKPWPSTSRSPAEVSFVFTVVVYAKSQEESPRDAL